MASGVYLDTLPGSKSLNQIISDGLTATLFTSALVVPDFLAVAPTYGAGGFATHEVAAGGGYTAGGQPLTTLARAFASGELRVTADDIEWAASTITARYCLLADTADDLAVYLIDFGTDYSSSASVFPVQLSLGVLLGYSP